MMGARVGNGVLEAATIKHLREAQSGPEITMGEIPLGDFIVTPCLDMDSFMCNYQGNKIKVGDLPHKIFEDMPTNLNDQFVEYKGNTYSMAKFMTNFKVYSIPPSEVTLLI